MTNLYPSSQVAYEVMVYSLMHEAFADFCDRQWFDGRKTPMTKPYPLGTVLTTRQLSQAARAAELFGGEVVFVALKTKGQDGKPICVTWDFFCGSCWCISEFSYAFMVVAVENQAWLSPAPMVGDFYSVNNIMDGEIGGVLLHEGNLENIYVKNGKYRLAHHPSKKNDLSFLHLEKELMQLESRNFSWFGRAPLLKWDEVKLPEIEIK